MVSISAIALAWIWIVRSRKSRELRSGLVDNNIRSCAVDDSLQEISIDLRPDQRQQLHEVSIRKTIEDEHAPPVRLCHSNQSGNEFDSGDAWQETVRHGFRLKEA
jgi:hypothetical protein